MKRALGLCLGIAAGLLAAASPARAEDGYAAVAALSRNASAATSAVDRRAKHADDRRRRRRAAPRPGRRGSPRGAARPTAADPACRCARLAAAARRPRATQSAPAQDRRPADGRRRGRRRARAALRRLRAAAPLDTRRLAGGDRPRSPRPRIKLRVVDHWDNLDGFVERGYAGSSLWDWWTLPDYRDPRYTDYARANASLGINGTVLNNVNAKADSLTAELHRQGRGAGRGVPALRHQGLPVAPASARRASSAGWRRPTRSTRRCARGGRPRPTRSTARSPTSAGSWSRPTARASPGPRDYGRTHADGANMLAAAVAPHGGVVMWRAFVYSRDQPRGPRQAGLLRVQAARRHVRRQRAGAGQERRDRLPAARAVPPAVRRDAADAADARAADHQGVSRARAPASPISARCSRRCSTPTPTRRATGRPSPQVDRRQRRGPRADRHRRRRQHRPLARLVGLDLQPGQLVRLRAAGVGPVAVAPRRSPANGRRRPSRPIRGWSSRSCAMMMGSREAVVNYTGALGLAHLMATGHHYGPGPWVADLARPEWNPAYYHRADANGIGFDRTTTGSDAIGQYAPRARRAAGRPAHHARERPAVVPPRAVDLPHGERPDAVGGAGRALRRRASATSPACAANGTRCAR